jgi:hypothetical protein
VFIHYTDETHDVDVRSGQAFCKACDNYASLRLIDRVRTVALFWILKQSTHTPFLICDRCKAIFLVKPRNRNDLEQANIHELLGMSRGPFVPSLTWVLIGLAVLALPVPMLNLGLAWAVWSHRLELTPKLVRFARGLLWAAAAVTAAFSAVLVYESYFGRSDY